MVHGQTAQYAPARWCQPDQHFAFVSGTLYPRNGPGRYQPVDQFDRAVMPDEKPGRDFADGGLYALRQAVHSEQQLMLLRLDAVFARGRLAEVKKLADLAPELGEVTILAG